MRRFWLFFAQILTITFAALFIISIFRPELLDYIRLLDHTTPQPPSVATAAPIQPISAQPVVSFRYAVEKANPAVVSIFTTKSVNKDSIFSRIPFFEIPFDHSGNQKSQRIIRNLGSGVILEPNGLILTNNHVVESADQIEVALADGKTTYKPTIIGTDPDTDLALLQIEASNLPTISLGNSESVAVGDIVLAIGNPFGVGQTVTMGIISAIGRSELGINTYEKFIQTDAAINPGNSGGPLIDLNGNVIGINTAIFSETGGSLGIGFAIPAEMATYIVEQIKTKGYVVRGWLGAEVAPITPEIAKAFNVSETSGVLVGGVLHNGPLANAGIKTGDIITEINGKAVQRPNELVVLVADLTPGTDATITVLRKGKSEKFVVRIGQRPLQQARQ
jgi:serine protease DegQ